MTQLQTEDFFHELNKCFVGPRLVKLYIFILLETKKLPVNWFPVTVFIESGMY